MATIKPKPITTGIHYPDSDGQPMAETPRHGKNMSQTIETLDWWFAQDPLVYVSGNMFVYYVPGDPLWRVAPDVFVVRGIAKATERRRFRLSRWSPEFIVVVCRCRSHAMCMTEDVMKPRIFQSLPPAP